MLTYPDTKRIKIDLEVSRRLADDIIVTAFDPGYGGALYWCEVTEYHPKGRWATTDEPERVAVIRYPSATGTTAGAVVGYPAIVRGLQRAIRAGDMRIAQAVHDDDGGAVDALLADVIVQFAVLGEVRYG